MTATRSFNVNVRSGCGSVLVRMVLLVVLAAVGTFVAVLVASFGGVVAVVLVLTLGMAVVTVVSEPAIRITTKDGLVVTRSLDVRMDLPAALLIGGEASGGYYEPLGDMLVPIRRESVSTLADFLSSPLRLPPTASGSATLVTFEGDNDGPRSNTVGLTACGEPARLS